MHPPQDTCQLSILLPSHNNVCVELVSELQRQAESIPQLQYEILVADDGSTDVQAIEANRAINRLPHCRLIERDSNVGRAAIRNLLAREAQYARLLYIDSDLRICSPQFVQRYAMAEGQVVVGGILIGGNHEQWASNLRYRYERACAQQHDAKHRNKKHDQEFRTTNFMIAKDVLRACPFDEEFTHYGYEDVLLGKAIASKGIRIAHIDNPILLDDYEDNRLFVDKSEEACRTLYQFRHQLRGYAKLITWQERLCQCPMLAHLLDHAFTTWGMSMRRMLINGTPPVSLYNAYKLLYYLHLCLTSKEHSA